MQVIDAATVAHRLQPRDLMDALERMFREGCVTPVRHHHTLRVPGASDATLLLMPAWREGAYAGIKLVTVFPGNALRALPAVSASYVLLDANTGAVLALIDGGELTARRTAATSALAARFLARGDAKSLLIVGTGRIARQLARFYVAVRPALAAIRIWGRCAEHASTFADELNRDGIPAAVAENLGDAVADSDIVSSATLATEPLIRGLWVRPGTHVDLVGGYTPSMREGDDALIKRSRVFVDTREGALAEAGDVVTPVQRGLLDPDAVFDLQALCRARASARQTAEEITVFKSVGSALEDLAAGIAVYESASSLP